MSYVEKILAFNKQMKEALELIYNELNNGQQKKIVKNEQIKELLEKYGVI